MTPETYAKQEYNLLIADAANSDLKLADPDVAKVVRYFSGRLWARELDRAGILQEMLSRVAGCPCTPRSCNDEAPGDHTRWCMSCLLRYGMGIEYAEAITPAAMPNAAATPLLALKDSMTIILSSAQEIREAESISDLMLDDLDGAAKRALSAITAIESARSAQN